MATFFEDFAGLSALPSTLTSVVGTGGSVTVSGGIIEIDAADGDGCFVHLTDPLDSTENWTVEVVSRVLTGSALTWSPFLWDEASPAIKSTLEPTELVTKISRTGTPTDGLQLSYWDTSDNNTKWDEGTETWATGNVEVGGNTGFRHDDWIRTIIQNDGTNARFRWVILGGVQPATESNYGEYIVAFTDWVSWSGVRGTGGSSIYLGLGKYTSAICGAHAYEVEQIRVLDGGDPIYGLLDGKEFGGSAYRIYRTVAYGGAIADFPIFTLVNRDDAPYIDVGSGGAWDDNITRHSSAAVGTDGKTYIAYLGHDGGTNGYQVGIATADPDLSDGTPTKSGDNPIVPTGGGGGEPVASDVFTSPSLIYDTPNSQWVLMAAVLSAGDFELHYWTNSSTVPTTGADWSYGGLVVGASGTGYRQDGVSYSRLVFYDGSYWLVSVTNDGTQHTWNVALFSGSDLDSMTAYGSNPVVSAGNGPSTTFTSGITDSTTLSVSSTTGFVEGALCVVTDDTTSTNVILARIRRVTDGTTLELEQAMTLSSSGRISQIDDANIDPRGIVDRGVGASPRFVGAWTMFGQMASQTEDAETELNAWATSDDLISWTFELKRSPAAPPMGNITGFDKTGPVSSWENPSFEVVPLVGDTTLTVADATHGHAAESPSLTQANTLTVAESSHAHTAEAPALTQANTLVVAEASHAHTAEAPALVQAGTLVVAEASHVHTAEAPALTQANTLVVAESSHAHAAESPTLSLATLLTVAEALHAHAADAPALVQANVLAVAEALHAQAADGLTLTQANQLAVQAALHAHSADQVTLTVVGEILPAPRNALGPDGTTRYLGPDSIYRYLGPDSTTRYLGPD